MIDILIWTSEQTEWGVRGLSPMERARVARFLRQWPDLNPLYADPLVVTDRRPEEWFAGDGVSDGIAKLAAKCCYPLGNQIVFSDYWLMADKIETLSEERAFTRNMNKQVTAVPQLRFTEDCDTDALGYYWSAGNRRNDVLSLFEGVSGMDGERSLDITHLLPPLPRKLSNTSKWISRPSLVM